FIDYWYFFFVTLLRLQRSTLFPYTTLFRSRICSPSGFAGPQPQHALFGAYFSWSDLSFIVEISQAAQPRFFCQRVPPANSQRWIGFSEDDAKPNRRRRSIFPLCDSICRFIPRVQTSLDRDAI